MSPWEQDSRERSLKRLLASPLAGICGAFRCKGPAQCFHIRRGILHELCAYET